MGGEWTTATIEECTDTIIDYRGKTPKKSDHGIPLVTAKIVKGGRVQTPNEFIRVEDYDSWMRRGIPQPGDVVMTTEAPLGEVAQLPDYILALAQRVIVMRGKQEQLGNRYFKYLLMSEEVQAKLQARASGSTVRGIKQKELRKVVISFPRIEHQKAVGSILGSLDDKIDLNHHLNTLLEQTAQAIFHSWFVAFDPVRAKTRALEVGCDPERAAMGALSGKLRVPTNVEELEEEDFRAAEGRLEELSDEQREELAETAGLFPEGLVESEVGLVPEGWGVEAIGNCFSKTIGGDWGKDTPDDKHTETVRIIRGTDIPQLKRSDSSTVPLRYVSLKKLNSRKLEIGDLIFEVSGGSKTQSTGRSLYISRHVLASLNYPSEPASFCRLFRPKSRGIGIFLRFYLERMYDTDRMWEYQNQSTGISNFQTKEFLKSEVVCIPSSEVLSRFQHWSAPVVERSYCPETQLLHNLRDTLLPRLISGELSIEGAGG